MKASIAYKTLDNITVVMLAFKNFKKALTDDFCAVNNIPNEHQSHGGKYFLFNGLEEKESGAVNTTAHDERAPTIKMSLNQNAGNLPLENKDSSNGGLAF